MLRSKKIQLALVLIVLVAMGFFLPIRESLAALYQWSQLNPVAAMFAFSAFVIVAMVVMFPVSLVAMTAGFVFGLSRGFLLMLLAGLAGFVAAFVIGRSVARPWVEAKVKRRREFLAIDRAIQSKGFLVVLLARLSMVLPYMVLNYLLALTGVRLWAYVFGSLLGMVPSILLFVFLGTTATDIAAIMSGQVELGDYDLLIGGVGIVAITLIVVMITRVARNAMKKELQNPDQASE